MPLTRLSTENSSGQTKIPILMEQFRGWKILRRKILKQEGIRRLR